MNATKQLFIIMNDKVTRRAMVRLNRKGNGLPEQAGWPFTKVVIQPGRITVRLFKTTILFTPETTDAIMTYSRSFAYGKHVAERGFHIVPATMIIAGKNNNPLESIDISVRSKNFGTFSDAIRACGFTITDSLQ